MPSRFYAEDLALIHAEGYSKAEGALADALLDLCAKAGIRDGQIVDLGCGHGGVAKRFSDRGYACSASTSHPR